MSHRGKSEYNYGPRGDVQEQPVDGRTPGQVETIKCPDCGEEDPDHLGETFKGDYGRVHYRCKHCQYVWSEKIV